MWNRFHRKWLEERSALGHFKLEMLNSFFASDESETSEHAEDEDRKITNEESGSDKHRKDGNSFQPDNRLPFYSTGKIPFCNHGNRILNPTDCGN